MLSMSTSTPQPAGRISILPTVKCSNCSLPVPLDELGSHVCATPPPLPTVSIPKTNLGLPRPAISPGAATSLLPQRLQGLVKPAQSTSRVAPTRIERPTVNTIASNKSTYSSRRSPLRESPVRSRPPIADFARARSTSNESSTSPVTARPLFDERSVNTQTGGEAGMAGVGRKGFVAAARAAMFTAPSPTRATPPRNIDTGAASNTSTTPPLSTSTNSSNSPGVAPYPESPQTPEMFGRSRSPVRALKSQLQSSSSVSSRGSSKPSIGAGSISRSSDSEYGLAYADSTDYEDDDNDDGDLRRVNERGLGGYKTKRPSPPASVKSRSTKPSFRAPSPERSSVRGRQVKSKGSLPDEGSDDGSDYGEFDSKQNTSTRGVDALSMSQSPPDAYGRPGGSVNPASRSDHSRQNSRESGQSAYSARSLAATPLGGGAKGRVEAKSKSTGRNELTVEREDMRGRRSPSPDVRSVKDRPTRKVKVCVRCETKIDDGKWVAMDGEKGPGVLCEKCWKNMYLPKCRRCNLPIERQAVSSSDGQLKGKYHRECFNCHVCHKPFPDKTFYVLDHKPLCAYHYHEANDSLCAAARCGEPIEGPCAVSHEGDRYHPEHFTCEYPNGCKERLEEYWEVDGRMLCERHSRASRLAEEEADSRGWAKLSSRSMKRTTRYIDLGSGRR